MSDIILVIVNIQYRKRSSFKFSFIGYVNPNICKKNYNEKILA